MNKRANLLKHVKGTSGWRYYPVVWLRNGSVRPNHVLVNGKAERVEALISAYGHRLRSRNLLQHHQRRIALCPPVGHEHFCIDDQSVAILDQQIPAVAQLGLLPITFARQLRLGIGSSMHASHSTAARRESSPWDCRDRPAAAPTFPVSADSS